MRASRRVTMALTLGRPIAAEADRPSCTDGCTPPASFVDYPGMQLIVAD